MLSSRLRELRDEADATQQDVANYLGITRPAYTGYETGLRQPDLGTLTRLADYFNVTTDYLLGRTTRRRETTGCWVPRPADAEYIRLPILLVADDPQSDTSSFMTLISIPVYDRFWADDSRCDGLLYHAWIDKTEIDDGDYFFLAVHDNNLANTGIRAGGLVLVRRQNTLSNGDIGLVSTTYDIEPATITRFWCRQGQAIVYEDEAHGPIALSLSEIKIIGKVVESRFKL